MVSQTLTELAPVVEGFALPVGQKEQADAASVSMYFPVVQSTQVEARVEPVLALYFPVVQAVHSPRAAYSVLSKGLG
jgi:hypothetical protein